MRQIRNVVLSGGSSKGLEYIGVYEYLRERNLTKNITNFIGVSIGSVFAMLWLFEMTPEQMVRVFSLLNWKRRHHIRKTIDDLPIALKKLGMDSGEGFLELFDFALYKKTGVRNITFARLKELIPDKTLQVGITNLTKTEFVLANHITTPDLPVSLAIRISISLPFIFEPIEWKGDLWADGGVMNNMPIDLIDDDIEHTLAFDFQCHSELHMPVSGIGSLTLKCLLGMMDGTNTYKRKLFGDHICPLTASHSIMNEGRKVDDPFDYFEFNFTPAIIQKYREVGYTDADRFFSRNLTPESDWSIESVLLHLIWKTIRPTNGNSLIL